MSNKKYSSKIKKIARRWFKKNRQLTQAEKDAIFVRRKCEEIDPYAYGAG